MPPPGEGEGEEGEGPQANPMSGLYSVEGDIRFSNQRNTKTRRAKAGVNSGNLTANSRMSPLNRRRLKIRSQLFNG